MRTGLIETSSRSSFLPLTPSQVESEESKREAAAQAYVDALLTEGDSPTAAAMPLLAALLQRQPPAPACVQVRGRALQSGERSY